MFSKINSSPLRSPGRVIVVIIKCSSKAHEIDFIRIIQNLFPCFSQIFNVFYLDIKGHV